jgi:hypothetical protein
MIFLRRLLLQGVEGEKRSNSYQSVCANKREKLKKTKTLFLGGCSIIRRFLLFTGVLKPNSHERRGMNIFS